MWQQIFTKIRRQTLEVSSSSLYDWKIKETIQEEPTFFSASLQSFRTSAAKYQIFTLYLDVQLLLKSEQVTQPTATVSIFVAWGFCLGVGWVFFCCCLFLFFFFLCVVGFELNFCTFYKIHQTLLGCDLLSILTRDISIGTVYEKP